MINWNGLKNWLLMKAISLAKNRQGLVQVLRTVTVKGTTFTRTYWIRPNEVKSNDKVIGGFQNLPTGHSLKPDNLSPNAKVPQEIRDIVTAYQENYLKTYPDKKSADEAFFNDLKANGMSWKEHPMPLINMMRAKMAVNIEVMSGWKPPGVDKSLMDKAKQHIRQHNTTPQPHIQPPQSTTTSNSTNLPPKATIASQPSKDKTKEFYKTFTNDKDFLDALQNMGIEWKTNAHSRINMMRAKEALALHIENGFDPVKAFNTAPSDTDVVVDSNSDTTVPPAQVPDNTSTKDESLLEVPDDATPAQREIIKHINRMTDVKDIRKCALMGMVPEDDMSKDYIVSTMIRKLNDWITNGMVKGFKNVKKGVLERGKRAPAEVAKRFKEDCIELGVSMVEYGHAEHSKLGSDLEKYLDLPSDSKQPVLAVLDDVLAGKNHIPTMSIRENVNAGMFYDPAYSMHMRSAPIIGDLNNAFSNYIKDNPDDEESSNLGYTGNDLDKCKAQFDLNKEGYVRYLRKLKDTYPNDSELAKTIDESIEDYNELMKTLNYNHNLLNIVVNGNEGWEPNSSYTYRLSRKFGSGKIRNPESAKSQLEILETQSDDVINTLTQKGYTDEEIMSALSDFHRNDGSMNTIFIVNTRSNSISTVGLYTKPAPGVKVPDVVPINTSLKSDSDKEWTTYSLMYTLMKFQKQKGIYGTPQGEKYLSVFRSPSAFSVGASQSFLVDSADDYNTIPERLQDYHEYVRQVATISIDDVIKAKTLGAKLCGREDIHVTRDSKTNDLESFYAFEKDDLDSAKKTMLANILAAAQQHRVNEEISKNLRSLSTTSSSDHSKVFKYYSGGLMKSQKGRVTQYGNISRGNTPVATYSSKELEEQIQKQLDNASTYDTKYVTGMTEYYDSLSPHVNNSAYQLATYKDAIDGNKQGIKGAMSKPGRDALFNILSSVISNIPGMEDTTKQQLAISLGYEQFDPANPSKPKINPKKPKKTKVQDVQSEPSPSEIKEARQQLFNRAMGTLATENATTNAEMIKDFNERFDYKPGEKTPEGQVISEPIHQKKDAKGIHTRGSRVPIFNSPFFAIKNTTMWEDRFRAEQQRMKDAGLDKECWEEMNLFHACSRGSVGSIVGRDQAWFMGDEYEAAGKMLGVGAYWAYTAGKSSVYCGDNPYSMEHYGDLAPDSADGCYVLGYIMRGENPKRAKSSSDSWDISDRKYTSAAQDKGRGLRDWEMAVRNNALILPHHIVDVSCRVVGRNVDVDTDGNFVDSKGNILANKDGVSVGLQQQLNS